jgi:hypothetical protein
VNSEHLFSLLHKLSGDISRCGTKK